MHRILAEKSVNITELRKNPAKYFIDQPVAVLSRLEEITRRAEQYLNDMTDDDFNDFKE